MNRLLTILLLLSLLAHSAHAADLFDHDPWTTADTVRQGIYLGLLAVDCGQTTYAFKVLAKKPSYRVAETNPFLDPKPSLERIRNTCVASAITHTIVAFFLPSDYRLALQHVSIGIEVSIVHFNYQSVGLALSF